MADSPAAPGSAPVAPASDATVEIPKFSDFNAYAELYKLVEAYDKIKNDVASFISDSDRAADGSISITEKRFREIVISNSAGLGYSVPPDDDELIKAINNAKTLSAKKSFGEALTELKTNRDLIKKSFIEFSDKHEKDLITSQENAKDATKAVAENKKENSKQKSRRGWLRFGKVTIYAIAALLGAGYLVGAFALAGGFVGLASISTMPFAMLALGTGIGFYKLGKKIVNKAVDKIDKKLDKISDILKGDENVLGSEKSLKNALKNDREAAKVANILGNLREVKNGNEDAYELLQAFLAGRLDEDVATLVAAAPAPAPAPAPVSTVTFSSTSAPLSACLSTVKEHRDLLSSVKYKSKLGIDRDADITEDVLKTQIEEYLKFIGVKEGEDLDKAKNSLYDYYINQAIDASAKPEDNVLTSIKFTKDGETDAKEYTTETITKDLQEKLANHLKSLDNATRSVTFESDEWSVEGLKNARGGLFKFYSVEDGKFKTYEHSNQEIIKDAVDAFVNDLKLDDEESKIALLNALKDLIFNPDKESEATPRVLDKIIVHSMDDAGTIVQEALTSEDLFDRLKTKMVEIVKEKKKYTETFKEME